MDQNYQGDDDDADVDIDSMTELTGPVSRDRADRFYDRMRERIPTVDTLHFELSFRPPFDWPALCAFLDARAIPGVESLEAGHYRRSVSIAHDGARHAGRRHAQRPGRGVPR